jgi:hypothetical protein
MIDLIFECPLCQRPFRVVPSSTDERVQCPHCHQVVQIPSQIIEPNVWPHEAAAENQTIPPLIQVTPPDPPPVNHVQPASAPEAVNSSGLAPPPTPTTFTTPNPPLDARIDHLLPPKFSAPDPARVRVRSEAGSKVILPTADGGVQTVDNRLVTIEYQGQKYTVVAMSPEEKRRRKIIANILSLIIAIGAIAGTLWMLIS